MGLLEMLKSLFGMSQDDGVSDGTDSVAEDTGEEANTETSGEDGEQEVVEGGPVTEEGPMEQNEVSEVEGTKLSADKDADSVSPSGGVGLEDDDIPDDDGVFKDNGDDTEE